MDSKIVSKLNNYSFDNLHKFLSLEFNIDIANGDRSLVIKKKLISPSLVNILKNKSDIFSHYVSFPEGMVLSNVLIFLVDYGLINLLFLNCILMCCLILIHFKNH